MAAELSVDALPLAALPVTLPPGISLFGFVEAGLRMQKSGPELTIDAELELQDAEVEALYDGERITLGLSEATASAVTSASVSKSVARSRVRAGS